MEEEQLDQREQKHREEEQLQMLPRGFVDRREQPDNAVVVRPFIGEMQQHSEDGDEEKTDGVGFEFHVGLSFLGLVGSCRYAYSLWIFGNLYYVLRKYMRELGEFSKIENLLQREG